jgi:hypothetical protein
MKVILANGQQRSNTMTMPNTEARGSRAGSTGQQGGGQQSGGQQTPPRAERGDGSSAREQIREVKDQVVGQARNTLVQARDRASSSLGESKGQFADQFGTIADALRRTSEHLRSEDQQRIAGLTETVARQVEQVADYLRSKDAVAMRRDLENLARRQPALVLGGALVLGLIGARFLKSSQRERRLLQRSQGYGRQRIGNGSYDQFSEDMPVTERGGYQGGGYAGS